MRFTFYLALPVVCFCASLGYSQKHPVAARPLATRPLGILADEPGAVLLYLPDATRVERARDPTAMSPSKRSHRLAAWSAWPGYDMLSGDRSTFARAQRAALFTERAAFFLDAASTYRGLSTHRDFFERDPINTLFGKRNVAGVLASMTAWEIAYSYASVRVPRFLARTRLRSVVYPSSLLVNGFLIGNRLRAAACNSRLTGQAEIAPNESCTF